MAPFAGKLEAKTGLGTQIADGDLRERDLAEAGLLWRFCETDGSALGIYDADDRLIRCNEAMVRLFPELTGHLQPGQGLEAGIRQFYRRALPYRSRTELEDMIQASLCGLHQDGADYTVFVPERGWLRSRVLRLARGGWARIWQDITATHVARLGHFDIKKTLASIGIGYALFDADRSFVSNNEIYTRFFPVVEPYCRSRNSYEDHIRQIAGSLETDCAKRLGSHTIASAPGELDLKLRQAGGGWLSLEQRMLEGGGIICLWRDATRQHEYEQHLKQLAYHHSESGLPNEANLRQHLYNLMGETRDITLICVQVADFKILRSTFGVDIAEQILVLFATRLSGESNLWLAHLGTSDFILVLRSRAPHVVTEATDRIHMLCDQPIAFGRRQVTLRSRIGVASMNDHEADIGDLVEDAEIAALQADSSDHRGPVFFDPSIRTALMLRHEIEGDLRRALQNNDELWLAYQPIMHMQNGEVAGFEALARWSHPTRGPINPADFIPIAEWSGLIVPLGQAVFRRACEQLVAWRAISPSADLFVSVNLSALQMAHPHLVGEISWILDQTGANPKQIKLELTESSVMHNPDAAIRVIEKLRHIGFRISIDDFGTGYSSLAHLHRLPIDSLKIDQSFIRPLTDAARNLEMARLIIELGHLLRLEVVAEGIERSSHMELLKGLGCDLGQGYLFSRPLPASAVRDMLLANRLYAPAESGRHGARSNS
ncbi:putative bifunctional diguanylate cyclase/phosphodiesterase [Dongia soli]|uniref:EAL domain-containing protein n=1 Tax=Dongia soli TaxID=600628 RepID=A0ABU5E5U9_9PROT|nr:EAL domain-containing protein [Dongia soli]MDY0881687.1 EAL domain-containing protein [Dongia soli]